MRTPVEIEMFEIDTDGLPVAPPEAPVRRSILETLDVWRAALDQVQEHAKHANSPGGFVAPQVDFPTLTGFREDVQVTMHADARQAGAATLTDGFLTPDIAGMRVDAKSLRTYKTELSWDVTLRTSLWRHRRATLRMSPSPSFHVTVVRLTPVKGQRFATRAFIRAGLRATYALVERIDHTLQGAPLSDPRRRGRRHGASTLCLPRGSNPEPMD